MKQLITLSFALLIGCLAFAKGVKVNNFVISDNMKIVFTDKNLTAEPNKKVNLDQFGIKEKSFRWAPYVNAKYGKEKNGWLGASIFLTIIQPYLIFAPIMASAHQATKHKMNRASNNITIIKPDGKKYYGKIAFYKVKKKTEVASESYYNITIPNERFEDLKSGKATSFCQYEYWEGGSYVAWVIWDVKEKL